MGEVISSRDELRRRCDAARDAGKRIVLTNGAFDILHVGHVRSLIAAGALGDVLVVALNADASVRRLKGPLRPVIPAEERAETLAALGCVDFVHVFEESDVCELIRLLRPHVYAKGGDYSPDTIPEAPVAREVGAAIEIVGGPKVQSVTALLERMNE